MSADHADLRELISQVDDPDFQIKSATAAMEQLAAGAASVLAELDAAKGRGVPIRVDLLFLSVPNYRRDGWKPWQFIGAWPAEWSECGDTELIDAAKADIGDRIEGLHKFATVENETIVLTQPSSTSEEQEGR